MSTLPAPGTKAASFALRDAAGDPCAFGPDGSAAPATLLFFLKHDCATCDLTAPLVERVHQALSGSGLRVLASRRTTRRSPPVLPSGTASASRVLSTPSCSSPRSMA